MSAPPPGGGVIWAEADGAISMKTELLTADDEGDLRRAAELLRGGSVVGIPTETVYGLAARLDDESAVERMYEVKDRPRDKKLSRLIPDPAAWKEQVPKMPLAAAALADRFWPGPLTLVVPGEEGDTVGLRCPDMEATRRVLHLSGVTAVAPSANISGEPPAVTAGGVMDVFDGRIPAVLDGGEAPLQMASTVVYVDADGLTILREGALTEEQIRGALRGQT